jgi:tRNA dimethylallyltransferase
MRCRPTGSGSSTTPELPPLIVVAGATATGKSALAMTLAGWIRRAEIVSADSRQVYRGMDIATAKPTAQDQAIVPHHCLDLVDPDEPFSAADYQRAAMAALSGIATRGGIALLVGGTGLYLRAIARGLPLDQGSADPRLRAELETRHRCDGLPALVDELRTVDAAYAGSIDLRNPRRVIRALERVAATGSAVPPLPAGYPAPQIWLGLAVDPTQHRERIERRVRKHFHGGLLDEARRLLARYPESLRAFSAVGYREAFGVLSGRIDVETAMATDATRTWTYARRQRTWFRSEPAIEWLPAGEPVVEAARTRLTSFLQGSGHDVYAGRR